MSLCQSQQWRPVYMDEVSIVLLRNRTENRRWIDQYGVDCQTHNFAPPVRASRGDLSNFDGNAGAILLVLGRKDEARQILTQGEAISPEDPTIHLALARFYDDQQQFEKAEQEFEAAVSIKRDDAVFWSEVGRFYESHGRYAEAREYVSTAAQLSLIPANEYTELGRIDLQLRNPQQALEDFARAEKALRGRENWDPNYFANIAEGRALAYFGMGERQRSIEFLQEALRRTPNNASRWQALGDLYDSAGQPQLAEQARDRSRALSQ